jgi:hypothetical protein
MLVFIPSGNLFRAETRYGCEGVAAYENRSAAETKTARRKNALVKNQYFRAEIPDEPSFLVINKLIRRQHRFILDRVLSESSLSLLYGAGRREFAGRLAAYLSETESPVRAEAARVETEKFYNAKREGVKKLDALSYTALINAAAGDRGPAVVSSYLSHIGIAGLVFQEPEAGKDVSRAFLIFSPRRDAVIKEIVRAVPPLAGPVS